MTRVEYIHSKCIIHRDIKPENFLIGIGSNSKKVYIIDFGLSKKYKDPKTGEHLSLKDGKSLIGTSRYASLYTHLGIEQTRRDDIESLALSFIYLLRGNLPWEGTRGKTKRDKHNKVMEKKIETTIDELCDGLPGMINKVILYLLWCVLEEYGEILKYSRSLQFDEEPKYKYIYKLIDNVIEKFGIIINNQFEWENIDLDVEEKLMEELKKERRKKNSY